MDPLTMALLAGGATAVQALPKIIPSKYERDQKKELKDLLRQQELGTLGLSERERNALASQYQGQLAQGQARSDAEMRRLATPTSQPGQALLGAQLASQARQDQLAQMAQALNIQDLQAQAADEQQIRDLQAAQAKYKQERIQAIADIPAQGLEAYLGAQTLQALTGGPGGVEAAMISESKAPDIAKATAITKLQSEYGFTPQEAEAFYTSTKFGELSPESQSYFTTIK